MLTAFTAGLAGAWLYVQTRAPQTIQIELTSDPFPLVVGPNTLSVQVIDASGAAIENATVRIDASLAMGGQLPMHGTSSQAVDGWYDIDVTIPMKERWYVTVTAEIPGQSQPVTDWFTTWVFQIPQSSVSLSTTYQSEYEMVRERQAHPEQYWIVIPPGTAAQIREGHGDDIMPAEIRMSVDSLNTLVIQNNDIADHTIGPFFVRAGEKLRQTFTTPQVYQGVCSTRHDGVFEIIVE